MNKTTNYQLNQWEAEDQVRRTDFNEDNAKLDATIQAVSSKVDGKADKTALSALQTVVNGKGNCQIVAGTYVGTGVSSRTLTFPAGFQPKAVIVTGYYSVFLVYGVTETPVGGAGTASTARLRVTWGENQVSWSANDSSIALNYMDNIYCYAMLG